MRNLKEAFGLRLKEIRKNKKYTQEALSEMIDLSPRQLIRIENGENFPSAETLGKLSIVLNTSLNNLFNFNWNENTMNFANSTYNKPTIKAIKNGNEYTLKPYNPSELKNALPLKPLTTETYESHLFELSKQQNKPITVDFFENKKIISIKTFSPDNKIKEVLSQNDIINSELYDYIISKIKKNSSNTNKLNYIKIAVESLDDKNSLNKLELLVQGMELLS